MEQENNKDKLQDEDTPPEKTEGEKQAEAWLKDEYYDLGD